MGNLIVTNSASTAQVAYDPVADQVSIALLYSNQVTITSTQPGTYKFQGSIQVTFSYVFYFEFSELGSQTGWTGLDYAASPTGWSTVVMSSYSYTLTAYFCNVTK